MYALERLPNDIMAHIMLFVGDDTLCEVPRRITQELMSSYPMLDAQIPRKYCQEYLLCKIVQNIRQSIDNQRTISVSRPPRRLRRKLPKTFSRNCFPKKKNTYKTMFSNIETRIWLALEYEQEGATKYQYLFDSMYNEYIHKCNFLSSCLKFTPLDMYFIRQCSVWIIHLLKQQKQENNKGWGIYQKKNIVKSLRLVLPCI